MARGARHSKARSRRPGKGRAATGIAVRLLARHVLVDIDGEDRVRCTLRKSLFRSHEGFTLPIAVGDRVAVTVFGPRDAVVEDVLPRTAWLARRQQESGLEQVLVANLDQVLIVVSLAEPAFRPRLIDRILVAAGRGGFRALIVFNKVDLLVDRGPFEEFITLYEGLGYPTWCTSAVTGEGIPRLAEALCGQTTVLTGQSGVGKSTLLNAVQPGLDLRAAAVSEKWGKGRHTTTSTTLIPLQMGGYVADTPGVRSFGIAGLEPSDVGIFFPDFAPYIDDCRFRECTHDHEPQCAVMAALEARRIHPHRYESYLRILSGMDDDEEETNT